MPNPSTIRRQTKRFKETGSVKNRKVNRRRNVLTQETLDENGEGLEHTPQKSLKHLSLETGVGPICVVCTKSNKIAEIMYTYCKYTHYHKMKIPV